MFECYPTTSNSGGEAEHVEWSKIQTPTDEVVVPYDGLAPTPDGNLNLKFSFIFIFLFI